MRQLIHYNMGSKSAIGIGNGICFKQVRDKGGGSYIDPLVRDSIVGLWKSDQNTNESPTRNIIKNTIKDKGGDLELLNFGYKLNSGYGKYEEDFTTWRKYQNMVVTKDKITVTDKFNQDWLIYKYSKSSNGISPMRIKITGIPINARIEYRYAKTSSDTTLSSFDILEDGIYDIPESFIINNEYSVGFKLSAGDWTHIEITQIPSHQGALVTDGKDDLITSTKTVKEMLGGSNKVTVVSMIHQIGLNSTHDKAFTNYIEATNATTHYIRSQSKTAGKTGIYGYTYNSATQSLINILGDKNDYEKSLANAANILSESSIFRVASGNSSTDTLSQVAWYWTFIANKVLTTDQINQVISYFNLDKHVKPDIIYDTIRQGITNENHASFNDELVDFSGNGHNMKIYNSAWNKESGINDEGAWQTDGVSDYGKVENLPIYKDYTVVADREIVDGLIDNANGGVATRSYNYAKGAFGFDWEKQAFSFGGNTDRIIDVQRFISYQSKYVNNGIQLITGNVVDNNPLYMARLGEENRYSKLALWSFLLFPYSLSEFLLERQLKRYKLGTLYPDMVEFRPIINVNIGKTYNVFEIRRTDTNELLYYYINGSTPNNKIGSYLPKGTNIRILVKWDNNRADVTQIKFNGKEYELNRLSDNSYYIDVTLDKSPQKIDIYADEYIRYEDIVQPYPAIINLKQDGKTITWGDKLKVGSDIVFVGSANLLPELYTVSETRYNGVTLYPNTIIKVEKSMVFDNARTYLKANEPSCILSPNRLRIPNSSYKILGYIPDLTGKGNHGRLNNFAYTEESGANEDGSIRFDGTDDHIIIPTIKHGGKALLMKVNWRYKNNIAMAYDQRINWVGFGISISRDQLPLVAYKPYNKVTYIDGIKNESVLVQDLEGITHNITGIYNNLDLSDERDVCISRTSDASNSGFVDMSMYEFMLFPDVPNEEEIKELNDIVGIEGGYVESPNYYWDAYGKKNTDTDRNLIADQVSKDVANALEVKNVAYNSESGYTDDNGLLLDGVEDHAVNTVIPAVTDFTVIAKRISQASTNDIMFITKGQDGVVANSALGLEYRNINGEYVYSFGTSTNVESVPDLITYCTPTNYNGKVLTRGNVQDTNGIQIGKFDIKYWKGVFYKLMFYTKTIDQLSINMLKNLFKRDELIDVTNPIFKKEEL